MKKYNGVLYNLLGGVIFMVWLDKDTKENVMNIIRDEYDFEIVDEINLFKLLNDYNLFLTEDEIVDDFVDMLDIGMDCRGFDIRNYLDYNAIIEEQVMDFNRYEYVGDNYYFYKSYFDDCTYDWNEESNEFNGLIRR